MKENHIEFNDLFRQAPRTPNSPFEKMLKLYNQNGQEGNLFIKPSWKDVNIPKDISKLELCLDFRIAYINTLIAERQIEVKLNLPPQKCGGNL